MAGRDSTGLQAGLAGTALASLGVPAASLQAVSNGRAAASPPPAPRGRAPRRGRGSTGARRGGGPPTQAWDRPARARHLWERYGLTLVAYERLCEAQGGRCAICAREYEMRHGRAPEPLPRSAWVPLHPDHDHHTLAARGLLCARHNRALTQPVADYLANPTAVGELAHTVPDWLERRAIRQRQQSADTAARRRRAAARTKRSS